MNPQEARELGPPELPSGLLQEPASSSTAVVLLLGATLVVLALLLWWRRSRVRPAPVAASAPPPVPAHVRALARLRRLREQQPISVAECDAWHVEAAALVREFVEERFAVRAPRKTTEELDDLLGAAPLSSALPSQQRTRLGELLTQCDRVKFAAHLASPTEQQRLAATAEQFLVESHAA